MGDKITANQALRYFHEKNSEAKIADIYSLLNLHLLDYVKVGTNYLIDRDSVQKLSLMVKK